MPFRIRKEAKNFFKFIDKDSSEKGFSTDFDILYFCFMAGISAGRKAAVSTGDTRELVDYFPDRFKTRGLLLVALFLKSELNQLGVSISEKTLVHSEITRLVDPHTPSRLSDVGLREFNMYVYGGYEVLLDWFEDRPRKMSTFVRMYKRNIDLSLQTAEIVDDN